MIEVFQSQHPDTRIPNIGELDCIVFKKYDEVPTALPTDCPSKDLEALALRMSRSAGPSSFNTVMVRNC